VLGCGHPVAGVQDDAAPTVGSGSLDADLGQGAADARCCSAGSTASIRIPAWPSLSSSE